MPLLIFPGWANYPITQGQVSNNKGDIFPPNHIFLSEVILRLRSIATYITREREGRKVFYTAELYWNAAVKNLFYSVKTFYGI